MWAALLVVALATARGTPWVAWQNESQMLLLHWPVNASALASALPAGLKPALWKGQGWVGLAALWMADMSPRFIPPTPLGRFPELDFFALVHDCNGVVGLRMFSIDAGMNSVLEWFARTFGGMPYESAKMSFDQTGPASYHFSASRTDGSGAFDARYSYDPDSAYSPAPGSLDEFLYPHLIGFFTKDDGDVYALHESHDPWVLYNATATIDVISIPTIYGFPAPASPRVRFTKGAVTEDYLPVKVQCSAK